jgi:DNA (cytosine-5)-methyltransferase 1
VSAYYNEHDKNAAQWLRNLIAAGLIAPGVVDDRSIEDVRPDELMGYTQCHFFAGIGVWSYALRQAGWPDDRRIWTGSCPCQPFSAAGEGGGFADERHLWPAFFHLIGQCRPPTVLGEQVASKDAEPWIDLVCADLGSLGYATGAIAFPAASVGAPHIRDRLYWLANAPGQGPQGSGYGRSARPGRQGAAAERGGQDGGLADTERDERNAGPGEHGSQGGTQGGRIADAGGHGGASWPGPVNGFWRDADWLLCRDGRWRPARPGSFPLAHGAASRVVRLRAYGNAVCAEACRIFIESIM